MKFALQLSFFQLIIWNIFHINAMELSSDDLCKIENVKVMSNSYAQVHKFVHANQNISQYMMEVNAKFDQMELDVMDQKINLIEQLRELKYQLKELKKQQLENNNEIVIQRRQDGSVDFYRTWDEYKQGFGNKSGEFFLGLEKVHKLTNTRSYQLLIVMEDFNNDRRYAKYDQFILGSEAEKFNLKSLGTFSGSAGDSLTYHVGQKFSTKDRDNDAFTEHCAITFEGAWWYKACHHQRLFLPGGVLCFTFMKIGFGFINIDSLITLIATIFLKRPKDL